jgi:hypothetical protein
MTSAYHPGPAPVTRRRLNQKAKGRLLAAAALAAAPSMDLDPDDPVDVELLAAVLEDALFNVDAWEALARLAGIDPPGASFDPNRDHPSEQYVTKHETIGALRGVARALI